MPSWQSWTTDLLRSGRCTLKKFEITNCTPGVWWYWIQHWILEKFSLSVREFNLLFFWSLIEVTISKNWPLIYNDFWLLRTKTRYTEFNYFDVHRKFFSNSSTRKKLFFKVKQLCDSSPQIMGNLKFSVQFFRGPWLDWLWLTERLF